MNNTNKMTLDEAIKHAQEVADVERKKCDNESKLCGEQHQQLADWLVELKELRKEKPQLEELTNEVRGIREKMDSILLMVDKVLKIKNEGQRSDSMYWRRRAEG